MNWGEEDLSSSDIDKLVPLVEPEKEKGQKGGDLRGNMVLNLNHKSKR